MELILLASSRPPILSLKCPKKVAPQNTFYTRLSDDIFSITAPFCSNAPSSPFCETPCYFCGCNTVITQNKAFAERYLEYLARDIEQTASLIDSKRTLHQLHWGGGTPNYLNLEQIEFLWNTLNRHFSIERTAEVSIEINPRFIDRNYIYVLKSLGFNRISFGIQDFNPQVQAAINRVQPEEMLFDVMDSIRASGFDSVNVDLIYGLPYQTLVRQCQIKDPELS